MILIGWLDDPSWDTLQDNHRCKFELQGTTWWGALWDICLLSFPGPLTASLLSIPSSWSFLCASTTEPSFEALHMQTVDHEETYKILPVPPCQPPFPAFSSQVILTAALTA